MSADTRFTPTAMALHWLAAVLILCAIALGVYMTGLQMSPSRVRLYNWHKWLGITILSLSIARLAWRLTHQPPADVPMPAWQRRAAGVTHWALYALFLAVPLAGWAYSCAAGFPVVVFGVIPLPDLVAPNRALAAVLRDVHAGLALTLGALVALHVFAVIKHQFFSQDDLVSRMLPRLKATRP
jgi:cytochrome b561